MGGPPSGRLDDDVLIANCSTIIIIVKASGSFSVVIHLQGYRWATLMRAAVGMPQSMRGSTRTPGISRMVDRSNSGTGCYDSQNLEYAHWLIQRESYKYISNHVGFSHFFYLHPPSHCTSFRNPAARPSW